MNLKEAFKIRKKDAETDEVMNGSQSGVIYEDTSNEGNMFFDAKLLQFNVSNRISIDIESLFEGKEYIEIIGKQWSENENNERII